MRVVVVVFAAAAAAVVVCDRIYCRSSTVFADDQYIS
jgi:hypothetical protein